MHERQQSEQMKPSDLPQNDELFAPSLQTHQPATPAMQQPPWRPWSLVWIAFFGGVIPYATMAYMNGQRLEIPREQQRLMMLMGLFGFIGAVGTSYLFVRTGLFGTESWGTPIRLASRIVALIAFAIGYQIQKSAHRRYAFAHGDTYSSLWIPGLMAVIGLGLIQNILVLIVLQSFM